MSGASAEIFPPMSQFMKAASNNWCQYELEHNKYASFFAYKLWPVHIDGTFLCTDVKPAKPSWWWHHHRLCVWQKLVSPAGPDQGTGATVNQQPSSVTDLDIATLDHHNHITEPLVNMPSEVMQSKIKKIYKPVLFVSTNFLCLSLALISRFTTRWLRSLFLCKSRNMYTIKTSWSSKLQNSQYS